MNWLKKVASPRLTRALSVLTVFLGSQALAWTQHGHGIITERVFEELDAEQRGYYSWLVASISASQLSNHTPRGRWKYLSRMPDLMRDQALGDIFQSFRIQLPTSLKDLTNRPTSKWHYHNNIIETPQNSHCKFQNQGRLLDSLQRIDRVLKEPLSAQQEAILLGFQIHLIQDLHQPLHTFTKLDQHCRSDRGGNLTCFDRRTSGECNINLHALWDLGFGLFDGQRGEHLSTDSISLRFDPALWTLETIPYYDQVYQFTHVDYRKIATPIAAAQLHKTHVRLKAYLEAHYQSKKGLHEK